MTTGKPAKLASFWLSALLLTSAGCDKSGQSPSAAVPSSQPQTPKESAANHPVLFEEISGKAGLNFKHDPGAKGEFFMPEQAGSGAAIFDFDNDGLLDIYLVQCGGSDSGSK